MPKRWVHPQTIDPKAKITDDPVEVYEPPLDGSIAKLCRQIVAEAEQDSEQAAYFSTVVAAAKATVEAVDKLRR